MRFHCTLDGLEENWVEIAENWTRKEVAEWRKADTDAVVTRWLRHKVTACFIATEEGDPITDPAQLTVEMINERVDLRLIGFLGVVLFQALQELVSLGPFSGRLSLRKPGETAL